MTRPSASADDRGLHAVIEDLARSPANGFERGNVTAQHALQVLVNHKTSPDQTRMAKYQREQPDDTRDAGLIGERDLEAGEIDLGLLAGRRLEAHLEWFDRLWPDLAHGTLHGRIAAGVTPLAQLTPQPYGGQAGIGRQALVQI